jgi:hypothetical protein
MVCVAGLDIRVAGPGDAAEIAGTLARTFRDDPVFGWLLPPRARGIGACDVFS